MSKKSDHEQFYWKHWKSGQLPELEDHSEKKLELLRDYLVLYLEIVLKGTSGKDEQYVTLIDGFAGGALYSGNKFGSPITILKAVEEAEAKINLGRDKPTRIIPICYYIEKDPDAFACLEATLKAHNYGDRIGKSIHLHRERFELVAPKIVADINTRHKRGGNRTIFFLDQCGWSEISTTTIRDLSQQLNHRPEFIVNFAISWLTDFISVKTLDAKKKSLATLGLEGHVDLDAMMKRQIEFGGHWMHAVEKHVGEGFHAATGIAYYSPFFIEPDGNHRGYWLLHLASSARARSAMTQIHWSKANRSKHYGHRGYDMLSYKPNSDATEFIEGMSFDEESRKSCAAVLAEDLPRVIRESHGEGISVKDFLDRITNKVVATAPMIHEVIAQLGQTKEFEIRSGRWNEKRTDSISDDDLIIPRQQFFLPGVEIPALAKKRPKASSGAKT